MNNDDLGWTAKFIWGIAHDVLCDPYGRGKYRRFVLPITDEGAA